jgi:hypothetical protein
MLAKRLDALRFALGAPLEPQCEIHRMKLGHHRGRGRARLMLLFAWTKFGEGTALTDVGRSPCPGVCASLARLARAGRDGYGHES